MAKINPDEYNARQNKFSTALSDIMNYDQVHNDRRYCKRLQTYFQKLISIASTQKEIFEYQKLVDKLEKNGIADVDIAKVFGVDASTVNRWKTGALPPLVVPVKLAEIFGVTTDYLLGVDGTADRETETVYDTFEEYGVSPESFRNLNYHAIEANSGHKAQLDYDMAIAGLNFLLSQKDEHGRMSILSDIGYYLSQKRFDSYYYFDSDDIENLYDGLFRSLTAEREFSREYVKESLEEFFANSPQFSISDKSLVALDGIRDSLKAYKMQIDPEFYAPHIGPKFFQPKTEE